MLFINRCCLCRLVHMRGVIVAHVTAVATTLTTEVTQVTLSIRINGITPISVVTLLSHPKWSHKPLYAAPVFSRASVLN